MSDLHQINTSENTKRVHPKHALAVYFMIILLVLAVAIGAMFFVNRRNNQRSLTDTSDFKALADDQADERVAQEGAQALLEQNIDGLNDEETIDYYVRLGNSLMAATEYERAVSAFDEAAKIGVNSHYYYVMKAEAYERKFDVEGAISAYETAINACEETGGEGCEAFESEMEYNILSVEARINRYQLGEDNTEEAQEFLEDPSLEQANTQPRQSNQQRGAE